MSYANWFAFFIIALLNSIAPGPGAVLSMSHALTHGYPKTVLVIAGQQLALMTIVLVVGISSGVILSLPTSLFILKIVGSLWLVYIGACRCFSNIAIDDRVPSVFPSTALKRFLTGFVTDITNAKTIMFMIVTIPPFIRMGNSVWLQTIIMMLMIVIIDTVMMNIYSFAASRLQNIFRNPIMFKIQNIFFGLVLISLAFILWFVDN